MAKMLNKLWVLAAFVLVCGASNASEMKEVPATLPGTSNVTAEQLIDLIDEHEALVIIDSRKASDHANGFIEGAIGMTDTDTTPESLAKHIATKNTPVAFYCNGIMCGRSAKAAKIAIADGYTNIYWFRGGWDEWSEKGYPVSH